MKKNQILIALTALLLSGLFSSCLKQKADIPADASNYDPNLKVTGNILSLKNLHGSSAEPVQITDDIVIAAIVTADDKGGNFYKQLMIQDSTSGIALLVERSGLYNDFPVGRKIYLKCKGLYISEYGNFKQIGYTKDETNAIVGIPAALISQYLIKATYPNAVPMKSWTLAELKSNVNNEAVLGTLIRIDSMAQFTDAMIGLTYAQYPTVASGTDRTVEACEGTTMVMRNSGYAKFQSAPIPTGRGGFTAIFSKYNSTAQLLIRDLNDVNFTDSVRCNGVVIAPGTPITIKTLREMYNGTGVKLGDVEIHGTIISSVSGGNILAGQYYMQDESGRGINIYAPGTSFILGDSLTIGLNGDSLILYSNNLEIKKGAAANLIMTKVGTGKTVTPKVITLDALVNDLKLATPKDRLYECTLVKVLNATYTNTTGFLNNGSNAMGDQPITDGSATIIGFCRNVAPYTSTPVPQGVKTITAIAANFTSKQELIIRDLADIQP